MPERSQEVDVLRRRRADIQHAKIRVRLQVLQHGSPPARMTGDPRPGKCGGSFAIRFARSSLEKFPKHARLTILLAGNVVLPSGYPNSWAVVFYKPLRSSRGDCCPGGSERRPCAETTRSHSLMNCPNGSAGIE